MLTPINQSPNLSTHKIEKQSLTYGERAQLCTNQTAKKLFAIMEHKQTNLAVAADVITKKKLLELADTVGPYICMLKTHIDIITDFDWDLVEQLQALAKKHNFLIFEDRKFADIGNTVKNQYAKGIYRIAEWAHITNAHTVPGPGIIQGLQEIGASKGRGLVLLPQMSSQGTLAHGEYTQESIAMANQYKKFVIGFICTQKLSDDSHFIHMTPGVNLQTTADNLGQQYNTPQSVIGERGSDIIIVGRGIYQTHDPVITATQYKEAGWHAYMSRIN